MNEAETVGQNIRTLRLEKELTLEELAARADTDSGNLSRIERGRQGITLDGLARIATALEVTSARLFEVREPGAEYTSSDPLARFPRIPMVGTAQLGTDGFFDEFEYPVGHGDGYVRYPSTDPNAYALRVKGDSMRPRIKPGEFVVIEPNKQSTPGVEVLVKTTGGRSMVKILGSRRGGMIELFSVNESHGTVTLDENEVALMHHVGGIAPPHLYFPD